MSDWLTGCQYSSFVLCRQCRYHMTNKCVKHLLYIKKFCLSDLLNIWLSDSLFVGCALPLRIIICLLLVLLNKILFLSAPYICLPSPPHTVSGLLLSCWKILFLPICLSSWPHTVSALLLSISTTHYFCFSSLVPNIILFLFVPIYQSRSSQTLTDSSPPLVLPSAP